MQLADALEVRVGLREHDVRNVELRHGEAVFLEPRLDLFPQGIRNKIELFVYLEYIDIVCLYDRRKIRLYGVRYHRTEGCLQALCKAGAVPFLPCDALHRSDELYEQLPRIVDGEVHLARSAELQRSAGQRIDETHLIGSAPLDTHLYRFIYEVDFCMECTVIVRRELIQFLQHRQLLSFKRVAAGAEKIQRHAVAEEDSFLALVNDELGTVVEVLDRMLPDEGRVVALILDYGGEAVLFDLFLRDSFRDVVVKVTDGADVVRCGLRGPEPDAALRAGKFNGLVLLRLGIDGFAADGAFCRRSLRLVENDLVAAVRALAACKLVRADVDHEAAGAVDLFPGEESRLRLSVLPAARAFDNEFGHIVTSVYCSKFNGECSANAECGIIRSDFGFDP